MRNGPESAPGPVISGVATYCDLYFLELGIYVLARKSNAVIL